MVAGGGGREAEGSGSADGGQEGGRDVAEANRIVRLSYSVVVMMCGCVDVSESSYLEEVENMPWGGGGGGKSGHWL